MPKFHYGTHYSTSGFTLMWLLRIVSADGHRYEVVHSGLWYTPPHFMVELSPVLFVK